MKRVLTVLAILLIALQTGFAQAQRGGGPPPGPPNGGRNQAPPPSSRMPATEGTVTSLTSTSTGSSFTLTLGSNTITVNTATTTTITNSSDNSTATLSNGLPVSVKGTYNSATQVLTATSIVVNNEIFGDVSDLEITTTGYTFDLTIPGNQILTVTVASAVPVTDLSNGATATVAEGQQVRVTGVINLTADTATASAIQVNDRLPPFQRIGVDSGLASTSTGDTFNLTDNRGDVLAVTTTSTTNVLLFSSNAATTLADGQTVFVNGSYDSTTKILTATSVVVDDKQKPVQGLFVTGTVASVNATAGTFVVTLKDSNVSPTSTTVTVDVSSSTTYLSAPGQTASLSSVVVGSVILAQGTFDATTQTLTATTVGIAPAVTSTGTSPCAPASTTTNAKTSTTAKTSAKTTTTAKASKTEKK